MRIFYITLGILFFVPFFLMALGAFLLFVFFPLQHDWNVWRMDARNKSLWETATAKVVTVEATMGSPEGVIEVETNIICYEGYYARPLSLKAGAPDTGLTAKSVGAETLQAKFPTGATVDINLRFLCGKALRGAISEFPHRFRYNEAALVAAQHQVMYKVHGRPETRKYVFQTDAGWVGHPYIVDIQEHPLRAVANRSELGTSETPKISSGVAQRWPWAIGKSTGRWDVEKECWVGKTADCDPDLMDLFGAHPR